jgi:hypothetical protein
MRRIRITGLALIAVMAITAGAASSASASPKLLNLKTTNYGVLTSEPPINAAMFLSLATSRGTVTCEMSGLGVVTTNSSKADVITWSTNGAAFCSGAASGEADPGAWQTLTVSSKGKASAEMSVNVEWPVPFNHCVYSSTNLKGTNSVSGKLNVTFGGKLTGTGCPESKVHVTSSGFFAEGPGEPEFIEAEIF